MKRLVPAVLCAVALFSAAAVAQGQPQSQPQKQAQPSGKQLGHQLPKEMQQFVQHLHADNQLEVRLGKLAQQKGQNAQVRDFGQMMAQDHQQADDQLQKLAQQKKWNLSPSRMPDARERAMKQYEDALEAKLRVLEGAAFDQAYIAAMVEDHDRGVALTLLAQQQYQDAELLRFVGELAPKLAQHRDAAYQVLGQISSSRQLGVGGAGMDPGAPPRRPLGASPPPAREGGQGGSGNRK